MYFLTDVDKHTQIHTDTQVGRRAYNEQTGFGKACIGLIKILILLFNFLFPNNLFVVNKISQTPQTICEWSVNHVMYISY